MPRPPTGAVAERGLQVLQNLVLSLWSDHTSAALQQQAQQQHGAALPPPNATVGSSATNATTTTTTTSSSSSSSSGSSGHGLGSRDASTAFYLTLFLLMGLGSVAVVLARSVLLVAGSVAASRRLHDALLRKLLRLPMSFFDSQPSGAWRAARGVWWCVCGVAWRGVCVCACVCAVWGSTACVRVCVCVGGEGVLKASIPSTTPAQRNARAPCVCVCGAPHAAHNAQHMHTHPHTHTHTQHTHTRTHTRTRMHHRPPAQPIHQGHGGRRHAAVGGRQQRALVPRVGRARGRGGGGCVAPHGVRARATHVPLLQARALCARACVCVLHVFMCVHVCVCVARGCRGCSAWVLCAARMRAWLAPHVRMPRNSSLRHGRF
jgi:hypothetical protein